MARTVIKIENLSKLYRLGEVGTGTISHDLNRFFARVRGKEDPFAKIGQTNDRTKNAKKGEHVWAVKDVNLEIKEGEVLGIIGKNGAGKSTLLKLLSRITAPTTGSYKIKGRMASLLEVGTGFHPEMTGRENIFMNGTIMGMRKWEVASKLDEIVEFAGVAKYLDTPVKRYSSGMMVRLGFAVAAHLEPEILVVDEVLAVGDAEFQAKAIGKMQDVSMGEGRTVLFVSHNMNAVQQLCNRGIILDRGQKILDTNNIKQVIDSYLFGDDNSAKKSFWKKTEQRKKNRYIDIFEFYVENLCPGRSQNFISRGEMICVVVRFVAEELSPLLEIGCHLYNSENELIFITHQTDVEKKAWPIMGVGENTLTFSIPSYLLNEGDYRLDFVSYLYNQVEIYTKNGASPTIYFSVQGNLSNSPYWTKKRNGAIAPILKWKKK